MAFCYSSLNELRHNFIIFYFSSLPYEVSLLTCYTVTLMEA